MPIPERTTHQTLSETFENTESQPAFDSFSNLPYYPQSYECFKNMSFQCIPSQYGQ
jgi:hypothetical protein